MILSPGARGLASAATRVLLIVLTLGGCSSQSPRPASPSPDQPLATPELPQPAPYFSDGGTAESPLPFFPFEPPSQSPLPTSVQRVTSEGIELTFVLFDARDHRLSVADKEGGPPTEWPTAEAAARSHGALAAINASFFTEEGRPLGLVIEDGRHIGRWSSQSALTSGVVAVEKGPRILRRQHWRSFSPTSHLVQAGPFLVENDTAVDGLENQRPSARSFIVWNGRSGWAFGHTGKATLAGLALALAAQPLSQLNITTALNLDGGRSSDLWVSPLLQGGPLSTRKGWNKPVRNYLLLHRRSGS